MLFWVKSILLIFCAVVCFRHVLHRVTRSVQLEADVLTMIYNVQYQSIKGVNYVLKIFKGLRL